MLIQYKGGIPYNTLAGLQKTLLNKIYNIEIDICVSNDKLGRIMVCNQSDNFISCLVSNNKVDSLVFYPYPTLKEYLNFIEIHISKTKELIDNREINIFLNTKCDKESFNNSDITIINKFNHFNFYFIIDSVEDCSHFSSLINNVKLIIPIDFYKKEYNNAHGVILNYCSSFDKDIQLCYNNNIKVYIYKVDNYKLIEHYLKNKCVTGILSSKVSNFKENNANIIFEPYIQPILPKLWIGNIYAAHSEKILRKYNIKVIINAAADIFDKKYKDIEYYRLPIYNKKNYNKLNLKYCKYSAIVIHHYLQQNNGNILVHCKNGHSRSALIIYFYLKQMWKIDVNKIHEFILKS